jgi:hypothetical protein
MQFCEISEGVHIRIGDTRPAMETDKGNGIRLEVAEKSVPCLVELSVEDKVDSAGDVGFAYQGKCSLRAAARYVGTMGGSKDDEGRLYSASGCPRRRVN